MNKSFNLKFGLRVKELRLANKFTQEQLAEKLGIERTYLARIETGKHFPGAENIEKLACIFNISTSELFEYNHFKNKENLINEIRTELAAFEIDKIRYVYKSIINLKSLK